MYMYDENGTPYLDFYAGIAVNNAGNRNPKVVAAAKEQLDDIMHTFNYPYTIPQALLAEKDVYKRQIQKQLIISKQYRNLR